MASTQAARLPIMTIYMGGRVAMSDRTVLGAVSSDLDDIEVAYVAFDGVAPELLPIRIALESDNGAAEIDVACGYLTLGEAERLAALLTEACAAVKAQWAARGLG